MNRQNRSDWFLFRRPRTYVMRIATWPLHALLLLLEPLIMFGLVSLSFLGGICAAVGVANMAWARIYGTYFWQTMPQMKDVPGGFVGVSIVAAIVGEVGIRLLERLFARSVARRSRPARVWAIRRSPRAPRP